MSDELARIQERARQIRKQLEEQNAPAPAARPTTARETSTPAPAAPRDADVDKRSQPRRDGR